MNEMWLRKQTRRSFVTGGVAALAGFGAWKWIRTRRLEQGLQWPLRNVLEMNGNLWQEYFKLSRLGPSVPPPPVGKKPRVNGSLGLKSEIELARWQMQVAEAEDHESEPLTLKMKDIQWLPKSESVTKFYCIEGWSEDISYAGVRFSDFMKHYELGMRPDGSLYPYVGLKTPDGGYYVSIDMESMLHPQTILAYEMNGQPLSLENGAPLRLVIPVKYGIKSLKRIGSLEFAVSRPADYWAERGYDWYAGL